MKTVLIAAMAEKNRIIGKSWALPWHLPEDLANFRKLTSWKPVIMGRKTYESLPEKFRPLPNRKNVVISSSGYSGEGFQSAKSPTDAVRMMESDGEGEIFVIGGSQIYAAFLESGAADEIWLSLVPGDYEWDAEFPAFETRYREIGRTPFETFIFVKYARI